MIDNNEAREPIREGFNDVSVKSKSVLSHQLILCIFLLKNKSKRDKALLHHHINMRCIYQINDQLLYGHF